MIYHNKTPKNWTATVGGGVAAELFSKDNFASISANAALRYNNYKGFGKNLGLGLHLGRGFVNMGYNVSDDQGSFSLSIQPMALMQKPGEKSSEENKNLDSKQKREAYKANFANNSLGKAPGISLVGSSYGLFSMSQIERPTHIPAYTGASYNVSLNFEANPSQLPMGGTFNVFGSYSHQKNDPTTTVNALGYMYSSEHTDPGTQVMDYSVEKESSFNKRDVFLGVPFNNADQFMLTAEGLSGAFRMYHKQVGYFGPRHMESKTHIYNVSPEVDAGLNFGGGLDMGKGSQSMEITDWDNSRTFSSPDAEVDEPVFFRFNGDQGGSWGDTHNDQPVRAKPSTGGVSLSGFDFDLGQGERSGRSSYIGYNTVEATNAVSSGKYYKAYSKRADIRSMRSGSLASHQVAEVAVYNENGSRYVYGLPVLNRNERHLSFGVSGASVVHDNYIVNYKNDKIKLGTEQLGAYASSYLLTEVTTPDYIDRSYDGPTPDDFGGYTRFNYNKVYGDNAEQAAWYKWRSPYNGLKYERSSLSDKKDDIGSVSAGEKEIVYLQSIETKSHVAIFYTAVRNDAISATNYDNVTAGAKGSQYQRRLTRIDLYSIADFKLANGQIDRNRIKNPGAITPLKTVHFKYYGYDVTGEELQTGAPNTSGGSGRLTLAKVYFEYNGLNTGRISPYVFKYNYPGDNTYPAEYAALDNYLDLNTDPKGENPSYSPFHSDAWGNYQPYGSDQYAKMRPWLDQSKIPNRDFDPAVWNLKVIQLPSKGEIHIQYEQDDYSYIQDQEAHVMAPLLSAGDGFSKFYIDHQAIGLGAEHLDELRGKIDKRYIGTGKKMYFKFLYRLKGNNTPDLSDCDVDYVDGYANVGGVGLDATGVFVSLTGDGMPKTACEDFVKAYRLGMIDRSSCNGAQGALNDSGDAKSMVMQLLDFVGGSLIPSTLCGAMNYDLSYLRVPTPIAKKGGGLRVKRLMTFDSSLGTQALYGTEYIYKTLNGNGNVISSGVATNEPATIREENILVDFVKRKGQSAISKIIAGKDKEQAEGPVGESILPGPSVGYSQVFMKNIYQGKTTPGYSAHEYYTAKDYPVKVEMTAIDDSKQKNRFKTAVFMNEYLNHQYATQGFSFIQNQMHGQPKRMATYAGAFPGVAEATASPLVTEQLYEYFEPGDQVPMLNSLFGEVVYKNPGREVDVTMAQKIVKEESFDLNVEADFTVGVFFLFVVPFITAMPTSTISESLLATHATSKVIRYPAMVKKTTTYQDGIYHISENVAFNEHTGQPVAVKSYDEFRGAYLAQQIPASWEYDNFGAKAEVEGKVVFGAFTLEGNLLKVGDACILQDFHRGDFIELNGDGNALFHVSGVDYVTNSLVIDKSALNTVAPGSVSQIAILNTGRNNQLAVNVGEITKHSEVSEVSYITIDDSGRYLKSGNSFIDDLNNRVAAISGTSGTFVLSNTYSKMNMMNYITDSNASIDWENATIKQVEFRYKVLNDKISLGLMAFDIACSSCGTGWFTVSAEGW
ncbi:hypothetical protein C900_04433 [Fulvivirga imtechensis AK7]|uniref:PA14 domain-containing protein n=1 Tax=Fulvivirga imtechensis AK7 TaxID=1237149 RepID=L8JR65_9BACT|nr:hypothetical protein C900_04433 [Fulvivirga imtechensis AK7]